MPLAFKSAPTPERELILKVLETLPSPREARTFLKRLHPSHSVSPPSYLPRRGQHGPLAPNHERLRASWSDMTVLDAENRHEHLAVIKLDGSISMDRDWHMLEVFAQTLVQFQKLGLMPVVLLDTTTDSKMIYKDMLKLVSLIEGCGGRGMPIYTGVFQIPSERGSSNEEAPSIDVDLQPVMTALRLGMISVIAPLGITTASMFKPLMKDSQSSQITLISAQSAFISICGSLLTSPLCGNPMKVIIMNSHGGIISEGKGPLSFINLEEEYGSVSAEVSSKFREDMKTLRTILGFLPSTSSAIVAKANSSSSLIANIITDKPLTSPSLPASLTNDSIPTLLRHGFRLRTYTSLAELDLPRLQALLEKSFKKRLKSQDYWSRLESTLDSIVIAGDYAGATIVTRESVVSQANSDGFLLYLDKFAVAPTAQGMGVADILWRQLRASYKDIFWRSRSDNPVNKWYFERSEGSVTVLTGNLPESSREIQRKWTCFFYGSRGLDSLEGYRQATEQIKETFYKS